MAVPPRRVHSDQPVRAVDHNALVDALGRTGIAVSDFGGGPRVPVLGLTEDDRIWARLTGSASPYSFTQVVGTVGGDWATPGNARAETASAHEVNRAAGLGGKVVRLERGYKDWRFGFRRYRGGGCGTGAVGAIVLACGPGYFPGRTVHITGPGGFAQTGTTDGLGSVTFPASVAGTYAATVDAYDAWASATATMELRDDCHPVVARLVMCPVPGLACCKTCPRPIPTTLTVADAGGGGALARQGDPCVDGPAWTGTGTLGGPTGYGTLAVKYSLSCLGGAMSLSAQDVDRFWYADTASAAPSSCDPLVVTFTFSGTYFTGSVTVHE